MTMMRRLGIFVGAVLFVWILATSDLSALWTQMHSFRGYFLFVFLFYGVIFGLDTLGWKFALRRPIQGQLPLGRLFLARLAGEAVNYVTPTASIGGEPVKAYLLSKRHGVPLADGVASVVVAKTTITLSMLLFVMTGLWVAWATQRTDGVWWTWAWAALAVLGVFLSAFLLVQFVEPFRRGTWVISRLFPAQWGQAGSRMRDWDEAISRFYREAPAAVFWSLGFHFLGWVAGVIEVYMILRFLGIPVNLATAWTIEALWVLFRSSAFMIPASLGASEALALGICAGLGIGAVSGLALGLIRRARELAWMGWGLVEFSRE